MLSVLALKQSWHPVQAVYFKNLILTIVLETYLEMSADQQQWRGQQSILSFTPVSFRNNLIRFALRELLVIDM